jgi:hypothetical protein
MKVSVPDFVLSFLRVFVMHGAIVSLLSGPAVGGDVDDGPRITYFGVSSPSDFPIPAEPEQSNGRPVYSWPQGYGISVVIEAAPGNNRRAPGVLAYDPDNQSGLPDLQVLASYPLGNGDPTVCEAGDQIGIPAIESLMFDGSQEVAAAVNDFGCRVDNGEGVTVARTTSAEACTRATTFDFSFVHVDTQVQFCALVARSFEFAFGDTVLAARVRDINGTYGPRQEIVVRVTGFGPTATPAPTSTPTPSRSPSFSRTPTRSRTPSPTSTQSPPCPGDCSGNHIVTVGELLTGVNIALERAAISTCPNADADHNGSVFVDELTRAVRALLNGC